ncbi:MAG: UDP-N-acetylglucosamine 1-carboxyvinyltransferase [Holosporales bacterium]|jgi:UDP-N-acetylglucosamine 1-carboxyvinyltransferase|nr:UDP-N-acetylglucosamine 1-carboxyvinyltransferase [Holosporales bacterium]
MDKLRIRGGEALQGVVPISGAKNAALPTMAACLLTEGTLFLENIPNLVDVQAMRALLEALGVTCHADLHAHRFSLSARSVKSVTAPYDLVRKMRASILALGPLVARHGTAKVSLPGGCAIGVRPVDLHLKGLEALGASINLKDGYICAEAPKGGLVGNVVTFPVVSVTGTENILMAATLARGTTTIINAALEPEISDLATCLNAMGAKITGHGTTTITIEGVPRLKGATHTILPDRIEAGTYALAAMITHGTLTLQASGLEQLLPSALTVFAHMGAQIDCRENHIAVSSSCELCSHDITTEPFPGYPTDLQAQAMAVLSLVPGSSIIRETIWENRFMHVAELVRMGADISVHGLTAVVRGVPALLGAPVMATDLRASFGLVLAGLAAKGETIINRIYHLDRGYEAVPEKLAACGASIERISAE